MPEKYDHFIKSIQKALSHLPENLNFGGDLDLGEDSLLNHQSRKVLEKITKTITPIVWIVEISPSGEFVDGFISSQAEQILGLKPGTIHHNLYTFFDFIQPVYLPQVFQAILDLLKQPGVRKRFHYEVVKANGEKAWFVSAGSISSEDGKILFCGSTNQVSNLFEDKQNIETPNFNELDPISDQQLVEQAIQEIHIQYKSLFERSNDAVFFIDFDGIMINVNQQAAVLLGYTVEELIGKHMDYVINPAEQEHANQVKAALLHGEKSPIYQRTMRKKDGSGILTEVNVSLVRDLYGNPLYIQSIVRDITERVNAERIIKESEKRYRTYVENAPIAIFVVDRLGRYQEVNQAACDLTNFSRQELLSMSIRELSSPNSTPETLNSFNVLTEQGSVQGELVLRKKDGEDIYVSLNAVKLSENLFMGFCLDITQQIEAEMKLQASERRFREIIESVPQIAIQGYDEDRNVIFWNRASEKLYGYSEAEALGKKLETLIVPSHMSDQVIKDINQWLHNGTPIPAGELTLVDKNGNEVFVFSSHVILTSGGRKELFCIDLDLNPIKKAEEKIRERELYFRTLFESAGDAIFIDDLHDNIVEVNKRACEILGYSREELLSMTVMDLQAPEKKGELGNIIRTELENPSMKPFETVDVHKNGTLIPVEVLTVPLVLQNQNLAMSITRDISERKKAEAERIALEERFRKAFETSPDLTVISRLSDGMYIDVNRSFCQVSGYTKEEVIGKTALELNIWANPDDRIAMMHELLEKGENINQETQFRLKDGGIRTCLLSAVIIDVDGTTCVLSLVRDITDRIEAIQTANEERERINNIYRSINDAVLVHPFKEEGFANFIEVNDIAVKRYGYSREEFLQISPYHITKKEDANHYAKRDMRRELLEKKTIIIETVHYKKSGEEFPVEINTNLVEQFGEKVVLAVVRDISERKKAEEERRALEERFAKAFHTSPDAININRLVDGMYIDVNHGFCELTGFTREEVIGKTSQDINIWENPEDRAALVKGLRERGEVTNLEAQFRFKDGSIKTGLMSAVIMDFDGETCILSITRDITERLEAIKVANEQRERMNTLYRSMNDAVLIHPFKEEGFSNFIEVNDIAVQRYGYSREEFMDISPIHITKKDDVIQHAKPDMRNELLEKKNLTTETIHIKKSGEEFPVEINANLVERFGEKVILAVVRDISERKKAEAEIKRSADELARLYRASSALLPSRTPDLKPLSQAIVTAVLHEFEHSNCSLILVEPEQDLLNRIAAVGPYSQEVSRGKLSLTGKGLVPKAIQTGKIINIANVLENPDYIPNWKDSRSELVVPLIIEDRVIGVLDVQSQHIGAFSENDERLMALFAERAALAIHSARLYGDAQRRLERLTALRNIDQAITGNLDLNLTLEIVVNQILQQLEVDAADILLYQSDLQQLRYAAGVGFRSHTFQFTKLRLGLGCAGKAALERRIVHISDLTAGNHDFCLSPSFQDEEFVEYFGVPLISKGKVIGVLEIFNRSKVRSNTEWLAFLDTLSGQAAIAIDNINMFSKLQTSNVELMHAYDSTIEGWAHALELRDMETEGHSRRVVDLAMDIAKQMGIEDRGLLHLRRGALLHDIGKIGVPDHILQKPGPLSDEEWSIMKEHPNYAYQLLSPIQYLKPALDIPYCHHEKWDGSGYPRGLKGEQIPLSARIFAIVDVWDALLSDRPYRKAWSLEQVIAYLKDQAGKHFDPKVVEVFLNYITREDFNHKSKFDR